MTSRNFLRRLEQLKGRALPPENVVVLTVVFVNSDGTVAPCGFTVDPWARRDEHRGQDKTKLRASSRNQGC
jgi:hypothetical protein